MNRHLRVQKSRKSFIDQATTWSLHRVNNKTNGGTRPRAERGGPARSRLSTTSARHMIRTDLVSHDLHIFRIDLARRVKNTTTRTSSSHRNLHAPQNPSVCNFVCCCHTASVKLAAVLTLRQRHPASSVSEAPHNFPRSAHCSHCASLRSSSYASSQKNVSPAVSKLRMPCPS